MSAKSVESYVEEEETATVEKELTKLHINVQRTEFSPATHNMLPSISPRETEDFIDDKKLLKLQNKFLGANRLIDRFTVILRVEILKAKPDNILDFIVNEFFSEENIKRLKSTLI